MKDKFILKTAALLIEGLNMLHIKGKHITQDEANKRMQLYNQGLTDVEIGKRLGGSGVAITMWRKRNNLLPQNTRAYCKSAFDFKGNKEDLIYLAGFLDGEGYVSINKSNTTQKNFSYCPRIGIVNTDYSIIKWISSIIGGGYTKRYSQGGNAKIKYEWNIRRMLDIEKFLDLILPYLKIKRDRAMLLKSFIEIRMNKPLGSKTYSDEEENIFLEMKKLNRKGVS